MNTKVTEKWLRNHGWKKTVDNIEEVEKCKSYTTTKHHVVYEFDSGDSFARLDHTVYNSKWTHDKSIMKRSNYYMFFAYSEKTGWKVENRISHRVPDEDTIKAGMRVVGIVM